MRKMTYKIIDGKLYQESNRTIEDLKDVVNNIQNRAQAFIEGIHTCEEEINKQRQQIEVYTNNIKAMASMEGIDKNLIATIEDVNAVPFCAFLD